MRIRSRCASSSLPCASSSRSRSPSSASIEVIGAPHPLVAGDVVGRREDDELVELAEHLAGERVEAGDPLDLVAEQLDPHRVSS